MSTDEHESIRVLPCHPWLNSLRRRTCVVLQSEAPEGAGEAERGRGDEQCDAEKDRVELAGERLGGHGNDKGDGDDVGEADLQPGRIDVDRVAPGLERLPDEL